MKCASLRCPNSASTGRRGFCGKHYARLEHGYVDATECRERYNQLRAAGYAVREIAELTGLSRDTLRLLGKWTDAGRVEIFTHRAIMSVPVPTGVAVSSATRIPAIGTHRRLQALIAAGYSQERLGQELGVSQQVVYHFLHHDQVAATTAGRVAELFNRLQLIPGPSRRAIKYAERKGWAPPLAWDEDTIDDPAAEPQMPEAGKVDWYEDYLELRSMGYSDERVAERMGMKLTSLQRKLQKKRTVA